jgi:hypothetical protein
LQAVVLLVGFCGNMSRDDLRNSAMLVRLACFTVETVASDRIHHEHRDCISVRIPSFAHE